MKAVWIIGAIVSAWASGVATENGIGQFNGARMLNVAVALLVVAILCGVAAWGMR